MLAAIRPSCQDWMWALDRRSVTLVHIAERTGYALPVTATHRAYVFRTESVILFGSKDTSRSLAPVLFA